MRLFKHIFPALYTIGIGIGGTLLSCNQGVDKTEPVIAPVHDSADAVKKDSSAPIADAHYFWESDVDQKGGLVVNRTYPIPADSLTTNLIIERLNAVYPEVQLKYIRNSGDTLFLNIPKSKYLTQQMGSSGPEMYFSEVVYNLTEVKGNSFIQFKFREGDHAQPGTFSRTDFVNQ